MSLNAPGAFGAYKPAKHPARAAWGFTSAGEPTDFPVPEPPPMLLVRKGWWLFRIRSVSAEAIGTRIEDES